MSDGNDAKALRGRKRVVAISVVVAALAMFTLTLAFTCARVTGPEADQESMTAEVQLAEPPIADGNTTFGVSYGITGGVYSSITSGFNGHPIRAGHTIWFPSCMQYKGPKDRVNEPVTIFVRQAKVEFTAGGVPYTVSLPDANLTFDPAAELATTRFNPGTNAWETRMPFGLGAWQLLTAGVFEVPTDLPSDIKPVTMSAEFFSTHPWACVQWKWGAAVYTDFDLDLNALDVKVTGDSHGDQYMNSDHAGTPARYKQYLIEGARGGGGGDWTGSYGSSTKFGNMPPLSEWPTGEEWTGGDE